MDLFLSQKSDFRISRLCGMDSVDNSVLFNDLRTSILEKQRSYPEIDSWLENRVIPRLGRSDRIAYLAILDGKPVGAAIFKVSSRIKLCHLNVSNLARRRGIGEVFLGLLVLQLGAKSKEIYFTVPESVWEEEAEFFLKFGFMCYGQATRQYRLFDRELYCAAPYSRFSDVALKRLGELAGELNFGQIGREPALLLSVQPKFAHSILEGKKTIEVRKKFSRRWVGQRLAIYSSYPDQAVVGEATVDMIYEASPDEIWNRFAGEICCAFEEFEKYCSQSSTLCAVGLRDVTRFDIPLKRSSLVSIFGGPMRPPQSYFLLGDRNPWTCAVSLASTLGYN